MLFLLAGLNVFDVDDLFLVNDDLVALVVRRVGVVLGGGLGLRLGSCLFDLLFLFLYALLFGLLDCSSGSSRRLCLGSSSGLLFVLFLATLLGKELVQIFRFTHSPSILRVHYYMNGPTTLSLGIGSSNGSSGQFKRKFFFLLSVLIVYYDNMPLCLPNTRN